MMVEPGKQVALNNPPQDGISALSFGPSSSNLLLVSSWDKVRAHSRPAHRSCLPWSPSSTARLITHPPLQPPHDTHTDRAALRRGPERGQGHLAEPRGGAGLRGAGRQDGILGGAGPGRPNVRGLRVSRSPSEHTCLVAACPGLT